MNIDKWISLLLKVGGVLEIAVGGGLLAIPSSIASLLLGESLSGAGIIVARIAGAGLVSLGISCWFARLTPTSSAGLGVAGAFMAYNIVACVTLALALSGPGNWTLLLGTAVFHGLVAITLLGAFVVYAREK